MRKEVSRWWEPFDEPFFREGARFAPPTTLGWIRWLWSTVYTPVSLGMWITANWTHGIKLVRGIATSVGALPPTLNTRARYGKALERRFGLWSRYFFTFLQAIGGLTQGKISALLLFQSVLGSL
jgi:hypothetical protein